MRTGLPEVVSILAKAREAKGRPGTRFKPGRTARQWRKVIDLTGRLIDLLDRLTVAVVGDVHGHLQLALCILAEWQETLGIQLAAVFLCGDVGTFTSESQLDNATRNHAKENPCELEFLHQWSADPPAPWLDGIFLAREEGGLGLCCPVVMVHGNHEGFAHLRSLVPATNPRQPVPLEDLPAVDPRGRLRLLPSGWLTHLPQGHTVAGIGGIEPGQRRAQYHPMAYIDEAAVNRLLRHHVTILLTHQGPSQFQGNDKGSPTLQKLLDAGKADAWFHGHSIENPEIQRAGPGNKCQVVPLNEIPFQVKGLLVGDPGEGGWALVTLGPVSIHIYKSDQPCLRSFRRKGWKPTRNGWLIAPPLQKRAWKCLI